MKTAVVIGATGLVGKSASTGLAERSEYTQVLTIVRKQTVWSSAKIKNIHFDFLNWDELSAQIKNFSSGTGIDFFCCLGTTIKIAGSEENFKKIDHDYVVEFARLAKKMNVNKLVVVSSLGADKNSNIFYNKTKGQMEADVISICGNDAVIVRPSLLLGDRTEFRLAEKVFSIAAPVFHFLFVGPLKKLTPIEAKQVAKAMVHIAQNKKADQIYENDQLLKF